MAKKKGKGGRPKGSKNKGAKSTKQLMADFTPVDLRAIRELHKKHSYELLVASARMYPKLPASTEKILKAMSAKVAAPLRKQLLAVAVDHKIFKGLGG